MNPGNEAFARVLNGTYVDKTMLIDFVSQTLDTPNAFTCVSRPRRFGKSFASFMLSAYYSRGCDSHPLFDNLKIAKTKDYERHINKYDVVYLDMTRMIDSARDMKNIVGEIQVRVIDELREAYPECIDEGETLLSEAIVGVVKHTGVKFVFVIDEWDAPFRVFKNDAEMQEEYIRMFRGLFKGGADTQKTIAAAYITGILPIKKYGTQSAMTDFREYTIFRSGALSDCMGFTEEEVKTLCADSGMSFEQMKRWYDGYVIGSHHIYNPYAVMLALQMKQFGSYWPSSESYESLSEYISMNLDGLKDDIIGLMGGQRQYVTINDFNNDFVTFNNKNNILALLVHLGYLVYYDADGEVGIPNLEIEEAFHIAVNNTSWTPISKSIEDSEQLLRDTITGKADAVANALSLVHEQEASALRYNDENSLACALTIAYYTSRRHYYVVRELPTGAGFADMAFIPIGGSDKPPMIIELKYDKDADTAIRQIKEKRYGGVLKGMLNECLLVGINYDKTTRKHSCVIERM